MQNKDKIRIKKTLSILRENRKFRCVKTIPKTKVLQKLHASVYNSDYLIHFKARRKALSKHSNSLKIAFLF